MPRPPLYNLNDVLDSAIEVFLDHGYHGAVMEELMARTGFNRRGFYLKFSSKRAFFHHVLGHYRETRLTPVLQHLDNNQGITSIEAFFNDYIHLVSGRGCLLVNAITELGAEDAEIKSMGRHYLDQLQISFIGCLEKALQREQIVATTSIESCALQLTSFVQGFAVNAVISEDAQELLIASRALLGPLHK